MFKIKIVNNVRGNHNTVNTHVHIRIVHIRLRARRVTIPIYHNGQWLEDAVDCVGENDRQIRDAAADRRKELDHAGWYTDKPKIGRPRTIDHQLQLPQGAKVPALPARGFATAPGELG
jgi:hypothetical protein